MVFKHSEIIALKAWSSRVCKPQFQKGEKNVMMNGERESIANKMRIFMTVRGSDIWRLSLAFMQQRGHAGWGASRAVLYRRLERGLSGSLQVLLFTRTRVQFPVPTSGNLKLLGAPVPGDLLLFSSPWTTAPTYIYPHSDIHMHIELKIKIFF